MPKVNSEFKIGDTVMYQSQVYKVIGFAASRRDERGVPLVTITLNKFPTILRGSIYVPENELTAQTDVYRNTRDYFNALYIVDSLKTEWLG